MSKERKVTGGYLEPQAHGGALNRGGAVKGAGRRPERLKREARRILARQIHVAEEIIAGSLLVEVPADQQTEAGKVLYHRLPTTAKERMQAMGVVAQIGMAQQVNAADVMARLAEQLNVLRRILGAQPDLLQETLDALGAIWKR